MMERTIQMNSYTLSNCENESAPRHKNMQSKVGRRMRQNCGRSHGNAASSVTLAQKLVGFSDAGSKTLIALDPLAFRTAPRGWFLMHMLLKKTREVTKLVVSEQVRDHAELGWRHHREQRLSQAKSCINLTLAHRRTELVGECAFQGSHLDPKLVRDRRETELCIPVEHQDKRVHSAWRILEYSVELIIGRRSHRSDSFDRLPFDGRKLFRGSGRHESVLKSAVPRQFGVVYGESAFLSLDRRRSLIQSETSLSPNTSLYVRDETSISHRKRAS